MTTTTTRAYRVEPERSQPRQPLDALVVRPRARDVFQSFFDTLAYNMGSTSHALAILVRQYHYTTSAVVVGKHSDWMTLVARGSTAADIQRRCTQQPNHAALCYWLQCRLLLEEKRNVREHYINRDLRNDVYTHLFKSIAEYRLLKECTPCDVNLEQPGTTPQHIQQARRIWEALLRAEPSSGSRRHPHRCNQQGRRVVVWYPFVVYCGSINATRTRLYHAKAQLAYWRARFARSHRQQTSTHRSTDFLPLRTHTSLRLFARVSTCRARHETHSWQTHCHTTTTTTTTTLHDDCVTTSQATQIQFAPLRR